MVAFVDGWIAGADTVHFIFAVVMVFARKERTHWGTQRNGDINRPIGWGWRERGNGMDE